MIEPLVSPEQFHGLSGVTHLCTGGEAPWLRRLDQVYAEFARLKSGGAAGRAAIFAHADGCREKLGRLWGVPPASVSFLPSSAEAMAWLARGLCWRRGDNVVTTNLEFPSVAYAWRALEPQGVSVRLVPHRDWIVEEADLLAAVDARTRVLAVSQVSFYTGQNLDVAALADGLDGRQTLLAVDATHAAGVVHVPAARTDLCVSSAYKWLLATHGVAPCYVSSRADAQMRATSFGWHNLQVWPPQGAERHAHVEERGGPERLEPGNLPMLVIMCLEQTLALLLDLGIPRVQDHALALAAMLGDGLRDLGLRMITPEARARRAGNTCFAAADARAVQDRLAAQGVLTWGEYGRVRVSGHVHNGEADVERLLGALRRAGA